MPRSLAHAAATTLQRWARTNAAQKETQNRCLQNEIDAAVSVAAEHLFASKKFQLEIKRIRVEVKVLKALSPPPRRPSTASSSVSRVSKTAAIVLQSWARSIKAQETFKELLQEKRVLRAATEAANQRKLRGDRRTKRKPLHIKVVVSEVKLSTLFRRILLAASILTLSSLIVSSSPSYQLATSLPQLGRNSNLVAPPKRCLWCRTRQPKRGRSRPRNRSTTQDRKHRSAAAR